MWWWNFKNYVGWMFRNWKLMLIIGILGWLFVINNQKASLEVELEKANIRIESTELYAEQLVGTVNLQKLRIEEIVQQGIALQNKVEQAEETIVQIKKESGDFIKQIENSNIGNTCTENTQWLFDKSDELVEKWKN